MDNRWFLISKVSMSEGAYAALLVSNIMRIPGMEYSDDPLILHALNVVMPEQQAIYDETFISFFARHITASHIKGKKNTYHIRYDQKAQQLEFVCSLDNALLTEVIRLTFAFLSCVSFKNIETTDFFVAAENEPNNISFIAEIYSRTARFTVPGAEFSLSRDLIGLYSGALAPHHPHFIQEGSLFDKDIKDEYQRLIKKIMSGGRAAIIKNSSPENQLVITDDLNYKTDGKNVINIDGGVVCGAHLASFVSLGNGYAKDDWEIYYGTQRINGADVDSFEVLTWGYAKDKFAAYYNGEKIAKIKYMFKVLRPAFGYAKDKDTVYFCGKPIEGSDSNTFFAAGESILNGGVYFGADKHSVYLDGAKVPYIDAKSFTHIGKTFFKDANHVYRCEKIIEGCHTENVSMLNAYYIMDDEHLFFCTEDETVKTERDAFSEIRTQGVIAADNKYVYYKGEPIPESDGKTAQITDSFNDGYIVDANNVFYFNEKLAASSATFIPIGFGYGHDGKSVFFGDKPVAGADAASFRAVSYGNAFDKNYKYCFGKKVIRHTSPNMVNIGGQYYKDGEHIYHIDSVIDSADHKSFAVITPQEVAQNTVEFDGLYDYAKDDEQVYFKGKVIKGAEPSSFVLLPPHPHDDSSTPQLYAKDSRNVYFDGLKVHGAQHSSFQAFSAVRAWTDLQKIYLDGKELQYIDAPTITELGSGFYYDINSVYYGTTLLDNLLPDSVMVLDEHYIRDDMYIYYAETLPDGTMVTNQFSIDYNTFDILHENKAFAFDKNNIFFRGKQIAALDFNKLSLIGDNYITDGVSILCGDIKLETADIDSFKLLGEGYAADNSFVYYQAVQLETHLPLHILGSGYATDGKIFWHYGKVVASPSENKFLKSILGEVFT